LLLPISLVGKPIGALNCKGETIHGFTFLVNWLALRLQYGSKVTRENKDKSIVTKRRGSLRVPLFGVPPLSTPPLAAEPLIAVGLRPLKVSNSCTATINAKFFD
jgi:hypothetical protein